MKLVCTHCGKKVLADTNQASCECGGLWDLDFEPPKFSLDKIHTDTWNMFRYREFMALEGYEWKEVTMGEGLTPIIPLNNNVNVKMDYMMPTLSYKDRGAAALISHCKYIGVDSVVQDSSGNAGNSIAAYSARSKIECEIFVPEGTSKNKIEMIKGHNAKVNVVPGTRDHCADVCRSKVIEENKYYANHVYNPFFYEGTKTYIYEVYEQLKRIPNYLFVPVGNGTLFLGIMKGLEHLIDSEVIDDMPNVIIVQSEYCHPIYKAVELGDEELEPCERPTLAEGIAIGKPQRQQEILDYIYDYDIEVVLAPEDEILEAKMRLANYGVFVENTTAAIFAAYKRYIENYNMIADVLLPMTGAGLKSMG